MINPGQSSRLIDTPANGGVPNNGALPAVILPGVLPSGRSADDVQNLLRANGWVGSWVWTVYDFHHFHPASHEVLVCVKGSATLQIGGPDGPEVGVRDGDVVILSAGFGHRRLRSDGGFAVVGTYPEGQEDPEIIRAGAMPFDRAQRLVAATPLPDRDPLSGRDGLLMQVWGA